MQNINTKPLSPIIFIPLLFLVFARPFLSSLVYPLLETYFELGLIISGLICLFTYRKKPIETLFIMPISVILLSCIVSHIFSVNHENSAYEILRFISYITLFSIIALLSPHQKEKLIAVMVFSASLISIYAIYQYFFGYGILIKNLSAADAYLVSNSSYAQDILIEKRSIATFPSPTILGGYLIIMFFFALYLTKKHKLAWISLILISTALLLTKSMGAWLSLILALAIYLGISYKSIRHKKIILIACSIVIALSLAFIIVTRWERLTNIENPQNSITQRISYWKTAINIIKDHPIAGAGPGNFQEVFFKYKAGKGTDTRYAHNVLLQTWAELGLLGITGLIYLLISFLNKIRRNNISYTPILFAGLAFIIHNFIDITYFIPEAGLFWWALLGILTASFPRN